MLSCCPLNLLNGIRYIPCKVIQAASKGEQTTETGAVGFFSLSVTVGGKLRITWLYNAYLLTGRGTRSAHITASSPFDIAMSISVGRETYPGRSFSISQLLYAAKMKLRDSTFGGTYVRDPKPSLVAKY